MCTHARSTLHTFIWMISVHRILASGKIEYVIMIIDVARWKKICRFFFLSIHSSLFFIWSFILLFCLDYIFLCVFLVFSDFVPKSFFIDVLVDYCGIVVSNSLTSVKSFFLRRIFSHSFCYLSVNFVHTYCTLNVWTECGILQLFSERNSSILFDKFKFDSGKQYEIFFFCSENVFQLSQRWRMYLFNDWVWTQPRL